MAKTAIKASKNGKNCPFFAKMLPRAKLLIDPIISAKRCFFQEIVLICISDCFTPLVEC
jgi:hypothetical protein